jgi:hypothetical protein
MKRPTKLLIQGAGVILLAIPVARAAQPVTIANPGFEAQALDEGNYPTTITAWPQGKYDVTNPGVWIAGTSGAGVYDVGTLEYTSGLAPEGENMAYTISQTGFDTGISQVLTATLQADATYVLTVKVGNPAVYNEGATGNYRVELLAGGVLLDSATGPSPADDTTFTTATVTHNSGAAPAQLGQPLEIRLLAVDFTSDYEVDFDDVQLTVTLANPAANPGGPYSVPMVGSLALDGSGSLPADGQTITTWEWDLNNDGSYAEGITGATPAPISWADLQAVHGMIVGANPIKLRVTDSSSPTPKTATAAGTVTILPPVSTFTASTVRPTFDGSDLGFFNDPLPSTAGAPGDKWWAEISGAGQVKGQTFTITADRILKAITYRLGSTKALPIKGYVIRVGVIDTATNTFNEIYSEEATQNDNWGVDVTDSYGTWTFGKPVTLPGLPSGTVYGVDVAMKSSSTAWQTGIPYPTYMNSDVFAGGAKYTRPQTGTVGSASPTMQMDSTRDREFHLDLDATTISDTTPPVVTSIVDQVAGGPMYEDQVKVTYLLNFNEPVDATTIDLADFANLGTGVSIDSFESAVQTTPYPLASAIKVVFGISGTGTLQLGIKAGSNIADFAGNPVTSPVADDTIITVNAGTNPADGDRWWDGTTTTGLTDGVSQGGTTTWDTTTTNWDRGFGFANPVAWSNTGGNTAIFGGTAGTVTLDGNINLAGLTVIVPSSNGTGYSIGNVGEDSTLTFSGTKLVTVTATGTGTNQDSTIRAGIAGSPTLNIAGRATNSVNSFQLLPGPDVTQTIGTLNMLNTFASNKRLILGGESSGNVVDTVTWSVTSNQLMLTKAGTGSWTITNDLAFSTGGSRASRLYVEQGTLTLGGTNHFLTHKIGVATNRESTFTASNLDSKLVAKGIITIGDNREYLYVQNKGTLAPGPGVASLTVKWNANNNATTTHAQFNMQNGATYEWDVAGSTSTDVIDVQTGGSNFANLILGNITLKIRDAGATAAISPTDQLTVFTYETTQPVTRSIGTVTFDTSALGAGWTVGTLALTDDNNGRIYLTGLTFAGGGGTPYEQWATGNEPFADDANADGVDNGLAWLLGAANPNANALPLLPTVAQDGGKLVLEFNLLNAAGRGTAQAKLQYSKDLGATDLWTANEVVVPDTSGTVGGVVFTVTPTGGMIHVMAEIPASAAAPGSTLFARLAAVAGP